MLQPPNAADVSPYYGPPLDPIAPLRVALRGHYDIEREIGQGAFATVYLAHDLKHERKVALKVLHADPTSETGELRFIREIRLLARLQHPNILPLHDSGHVEALLYYVMPYVSGETLRERIDRLHQLPTEAACDIARDVGDALAYAHAQGIIHRDIKPENILLSTGHPILADFGIARAIDLAGVRQLTRTGMGSPGTPAYMSPEQLMGDKELDGRSDTYSLACVLYEMLTGKPPFGGKEGFVRRFTEPPPSVTLLRKDLPDWLDSAIARAMAREPRDRYPTATDFITALCPPATGPGVMEGREQQRITPTFPILTTQAGENPLALLRTDQPPAAPSYVPAVQSPREYGELGIWKSFLQYARSRPRIVGGVVIGGVLVAIALGATVTPSRIRGVLGDPRAIDTTRFVILPISAYARYPKSIGERASDGLYDALGAWTGLKLVSDADVDDAIRSAGEPPATLGDAFRLARRLGAGQMVLARVVSGSGSHRVRAELFDVARSASTGRFALIDSSSSPQDFARATLALLAIPNRPVVAEDGDGLTHSYNAWTSYNQGHVALREWNLVTAARHFGEAVSADPGFSVAHLWLAQIQSWTNPDRRVDWGGHAAKAVQDARLTGRDRTIAQALLALAEQRYPAACDAYSALTKSNPVDFVGWYGLGECQALDSTVVPAGGRSPSGWRFRSSYRAAADAYMGALEIDPRAHVMFEFHRLQRLLPTSATKLRVGKSEPPNSETFVAYPSLEGTRDTLAFIPYSLSRFAVLPLKAMRTRNLALEANTEVLLEFARNWTRQSPADPAAFEALAEVLESSGEITGEPFEETAVMRALQQARAVTRDPRQVFRTVVRETWLRFKREDFAQARRLADSLLIARPRPTATDAAALIALAALTGKIDRAVEMGRLTQAFLPASAGSLPAQIRDAASELFINAALGICGEHIARLEKQLDDAVVRYVPAERGARLRGDLMDRPLSMTVPCTAGQSALKIKSPDDRLSQMQQAYARNNLRLVRALLDTVAEIERLGRPGDMSLDYTYQQAWLRVAIGDTAVAVRLLDNSLGALPALSADNLQELASAAAVGRAMALRATLAGALGDSKTERRWAHGLATLWETADPPLNAVPNNLRTFAGAGRVF